MTIKKLAIMSLGLVLISTQCDPILRAEAGGQKQETVIESTDGFFRPETLKAMDGEVLEVNCLMEESNINQVTVSPVLKVAQDTNRAAVKSLETNLHAKARGLRENRVAAIEAGKAKQADIETQAKAAEEARIKAEKEAREKALAEDATGKTYKGIQLQYSEIYEGSKGHITRSNGSIRFNGHRETWYSTREGCGKNTAVAIPGKHVAKDGIIRDKDGYICVASNQKFLRVYSTLMTSVGPAKVYDTGCSYGTIDIYTTW